MLRNTQSSPPKVMGPKSKIYLPVMSLSGTLDVSQYLSFSLEPRNTVWNNSKSSVQHAMNCSSEEKCKNHGGTQRWIDWNSWQHPYLHLFFTALFQLLFCCFSWFWFLYGKPHHLTSRLCWSFQAAFPLRDYTTYTLTSTCTAAFVSIGHPSSECNCKGYFADKVLNPQVPAPAAAAPRTPAACKHHQPFSCPFPSLAPFPSHDLPFWSWHPLPVLAALAPSSVYKIKLPGHNPIGGLPPIQQVEMPPPHLFFFLWRATAG